VLNVGTRVDGPAKDIEEEKGIELSDGVIVSELEVTVKVAEDGVAEIVEGEAVTAESVNEFEGVVVAAAGKGINA
jgi:ribosomal protein L19